MTRTNTCSASALRGAAFGASFGAAFWLALLAFAHFAGPTESSLPSSAPAVGGQVPRPAARAEAAPGDAKPEPPAAQVQVLRDGARVALARRVRRPSGATSASGPAHIPRRDPARVLETTDSTPSAPLASGDLQEMAALLTQLTQGTSGSSPLGMGSNELSPELLQTLLGEHGGHILELSGVAQGRAH